MGKERLGSGKEKEGTAEKGWKLYRNFNAVVGAAALLAAGVLPPAGYAIAVGYGALNVAQAGFGEFMRDRSKKKRLRKPK